MKHLAERGEPLRMQVICAWCNSDITEEGLGINTDLVSHGICQDCRNALPFREGVSLQQFIDSIPYPIVVVDKDTTVMFGNAKAYKILGKAPNAVTGHSFGEVFECSYSRLPGGCGSDICCSGCTIRRTVVQTFQTGEAQNQIPAMLTRHEAEVSLQVTTLKADDIVLLRIDLLQKH